MTRPTGLARHAGGMNIYLINALLVLLVVRQIHEHQLDLRALAVPVLAVGAAAVMFLHAVPSGGSDIVLDLACLSAGAASFKSLYLKRPFAQRDDDHRVGTSDTAQRPMGTNLWSTSDSAIWPQSRMRSTGLSVRPVAGSEIALRNLSIAACIYVISPGQLSFR